MAARELGGPPMVNTLMTGTRWRRALEVDHVILSKARIFAEAGELFAGSKMPERLATTVFKSVGIAVGDIAAARLVYDAIGSC